MSHESSPKTSSLSNHKLIVKYVFFTEMAEGNGELVDDLASMSSQDRGDGEKTEDYPKLIEYGLDKRVSTNSKPSRTNFYISIVIFRWLAN